MERPKSSIDCTREYIGVYTLMENVEVFDNHREAVKTLNSIKSYNSYLCHFKLQFVKANNDKQHGAIYMAFHCIHSSIPLSEIQK